MEYYDPMEKNCQWCRRPPAPMPPQPGPRPPMPPQYGPGFRPILFQETVSGQETEEYENERDLERLKNLYPEVAKDILPYVEEECDRLEYEGSIMFDEYPDKNMLSRITAKIYDQVKEQYDPPEGDDQDEMLAMNAETRRRYPPRKNWLGDLVEVLLFDEIFRRRCRRRNCRRY